MTLRAGSGSKSEPSLATSAVSSTVYDREYYTSRCAGAETWTASGGTDADPMYIGSLQKARFHPGGILVDVGTGRGELLRAAADLGAVSAIGIEYSHDALDLARVTLASVDGPASLIAADSRLLPLPSNFADLVTMLDVVEHLTPPELHRTLAEARRILRPGGRVFIHTFPTKTIYDVTYRLQRLSLPWRLRRWPADPRNEFEHRMHVNEQSLRSLQRALRQAGFSGVTVEYGQWIWDGFVPSLRSRRLYRRLARLPVTRGLGAADLWAEATKE